MAKPSPSLPRSLKVVFIFSAFLVVLIAVSDIKQAYPLRDLISGAVDHLLIVVTAVLVGGILLWIIEEAIEHHIAPAIQGGLETLARAIREEIQKFPKAWEGLPQTLALVRESIVNKEVRDLTLAGRTQEAVEKAAPQDKVKALIQSKEPADWKLAVEIMTEIPDPQPRPALTLAYLCWQMGDIHQAIKLAEIALHGAKGDPEILWKTHNSLAYYFAETSDPRYERAAREYVAAARLEVPDRPEPIDTEAFVKITFGKSRDEVMEGVKIAEEARARGAPFDAYAKHIARAGLRLKTIK